jgi:quinol monooxygenase YgiN
MAYVAISMMVPVSGEEGEVERINKELMDYARSLEGCLSAHALKATDTSGYVCRVSEWESEDYANRGIQTMHAMSLRAELHLKVQPGHMDKGFTEI